MFSYGKQYKEIAMAEGFICTVNRISINDTPTWVEVQFDEGENKVMCISLRELLDILKNKFPDEVFERIWLRNVVVNKMSSGYQQATLLITNKPV